MGTKKEKLQVASMSLERILLREIAIMEEGNKRTLARLIRDGRVKSRFNELSEAWIERCREKGWKHDLGVPAFLARKKGEAQIEVEWALFADLEVGEEYYPEWDLHLTTHLQKTGPDECQELRRFRLGKQDGAQRVQRIVRRDR